MLSRRNVRIKVMQTLYAANRNGQLTLRAVQQQYQRLVQRSFDLYLLNVLILIRVAEYARQDKARRENKLLPSDEDKAFRPHLADNVMIQSLSKHPALTRAFSKAQLMGKLDADIIRNLYIEFAQQEEDYLAYATSTEHSPEVHREKVLSLYKFLINHDSFVDLVEDQFPLWSDDKSLVVGAMKKTIKSLPAEDDFLDAYEPADETVKDFGEALLTKVIEADQELLNLIEPTLKNWDADRVAILDMILIKMALSEMLHFPTIPTKVTLNEFVELAKQYSTDKSKDFINGILDRLLKQLTDDGLINKKGRGLVDE